MKRKIKRNLLLAGSTFVGIGTIVAEVAVDNYLKKNLSNPNSLGSTVVRSFTGSAIAATGFTIASGMIEIASNIDVADDFIKNHLDYDDDEEFYYDIDDENEYSDEDFDAADLDDVDEEVDPVSDHLESIIDDLVENNDVSESEETSEQEVEKTTDDSNVENDKSETTESEESTKSDSYKGKKRK